MPVNTAALKTFAPAMRRQLLEAVGRKLDLLLNSQTPDTLSTYAKQIAELREQEGENRDQLLERVAYTWFNRLCALRYLDAKGWHPFGCKVLMQAAEGETQPELLKLMRSGSLPAELKTYTNEARLHGLLDGQIPPAISGADPQGEVYRELVLASCRSYHQLLPELFEGLDDASELLLPDELLSEGSIAGNFRSAISDEDCENVEIIGWLYQFYISEKKDQVIGKVVKSEDIPAATQLFTPNWIVKYMVQNTLGATWLATYPDSPLKGQMEFYIEPAEQSPEVQAQQAAITPESLDPEALTLIDPACGSGHILVEAYDLLKAIYLERGYRQRDIPELILTKNLFGLDICPRAAQLTAFSLLMKGREDARRLLERGIKLNVMALQDSTGLNVERLAATVDLAAAGVSRADIRMLAEIFTHATTYGSLIQVPPILANKLPTLIRLAEHESQDLFASADLQSLDVLARQAGILSSRYDAVVANPPYMGSKGMNPLAKDFAKTHFPDAKTDLFSCFIERNLAFCNSIGRTGIMSPFVWMFISSYEDLRSRLINQEAITSLIQLEYSGFEGATVPICTFVLRKGHTDGQKGCFIRLSDFRGAANQAPKTLEAIRNRHCGWFFEICQDEFKKIPGSPITYWLGDKIELFNKYRSIAQERDPQVGLQTSNNGRFVRFWWEVPRDNLCIGATSSQAAIESARKWFPFNKGGDGRRWSANAVAVVNWFNDGEEIKASIIQKYPYLNGNPDYVVKDRGYYFKPGVIGNKISSAGFSVAYTDKGFLFSNADMLVPVINREEALVYCAFLNSSLAKDLLEGIAPTLNFEKGQIGSLPLPSDVSINTVYARKCIDLSEAFWARRELSLSFAGLPASCEDKQFAGYIKKLGDQEGFFLESLASLEASNDNAILEAFSLSVAPSTHANKTGTGGDYPCHEKDIVVSWVSYATGCMMGRYSLDQPGLILADARESQAEHLDAYEEKVGKPLSEVQFKPDPDGIIPVLDGEWFEDDTVARFREFLAVTFPESSVAENLRFIEESLGKDIRKYFCSEFYKDHLQTYKKRPIYWLVQSPKKGFSCLIYLHRYTKDTLNQVLNNYFRPYLQKLEARLAQLGLDQLNDDLPARERTAARKEAEKITKVLKECQAWEQDSLLPLAQQRIELDLDDGVKVNYLKLQDVLAPIPGLAAKEE
ncbi:MAG: BREX-1 system adenine-specific DNA-methyltransferase PglX [Prochlorococcaceae cyanobacterium]